MTTETVLAGLKVSEIYSRYGSHNALRFARAIEQAVLQSPEVQALRKDAERYRHAVSSVSEGRVDICVCQIEWDIEGIDAYTFLIGSDADYVIDAAMEQQK